jgi:hypothetical protein
MRLEILQVPDCPNAAVLDSRLARVLAGQYSVQVSRHIVTTEAQARRLGMAGSPTLLIDGADPFARPGQQAALACRMYPGGDGRPAPAPSHSQIREALKLWHSQR